MSGGRSLGACLLWTFLIMSMAFAVFLLFEGVMAALAGR